MFQSEAVQRYDEIDAGNARLRTLLLESTGKGAWRLVDACFSSLPA